MCSMPPEPPPLGCTAGGFAACPPDGGKPPQAVPNGTPKDGGLTPNAGQPGEPQPGGASALTDTASGAGRTSR